MSDPKKDVREFFKALSDSEDNFQKYLLGTAAFPIFSSSLLDPIAIDSVKADLLRNRSSSPSLAESTMLDVVFKFDSCIRDMSIRKKRRSDYYIQATTGYEDEKSRLKASSLIAIQVISGNSTPQKGGGPNG